MSDSTYNFLLNKSIEIIKILCISFICAWLFSEFIMFKAFVPTGSMRPTIMEGDNIMISKLYSKIDRGDIMVFSKDISTDYLIKRVVGLPGDKIEIIDGIVYINGDKYDEEYVVYPKSTYNIFNIPEDSYLFFGDNRADSEDARAWKEPYVHKDDIIGKAILRVYPFDKVGFVN